MIKVVILLVVGLLTLLVGVAMLRDSTYNKDKFQTAMNNLQSKSPVDFIMAIEMYNAKCNSLSLYGALSIAYGLIVVGLSAYCLYLGPDHGKSSLAVVGGITAVGVVLILVAMAVKKIHSPNPVKGSSKK